MSGLENIYLRVIDREIEIRAMGLDRISYKVKSVFKEQKFKQFQKLGIRGRKQQTEEKPIRDTEGKLRQSVDPKSKWSTEKN